MGQTIPVNPWRDNGKGSLHQKWLNHYYNIIPILLQRELFYKASILLRLRIRKSLPLKNKFVCVKSLCIPSRSLSHSLTLYLALSIYRSCSFPHFLVLFGSVSLFPAPPVVFPLLARSFPLSLTLSRPLSCSLVHYPARSPRI